MENWSQKESEENRDGGGGGFGGHSISRYTSKPKWTRMLRRRVLFCYDNIP